MCYRSPSNRSLSQFWLPLMVLLVLLAAIASASHGSDASAPVNAAKPSSAVNVARIPGTPGPLAEGCKCPPWMPPPATTPVSVWTRPEPPLVAIPAIYHEPYPPRRIRTYGYVVDNSDGLRLELDGHWIQVDYVPENVRANVPIGALVYLTGTRTGRMVSAESWEAWSTLAGSAIKVGWSQ